MKIKKTDIHLNEKPKAPYFRELYELEKQKLELVKPILSYRLKHKLNQKQLADRAGVTQQHISKIESGDFSNIATLGKVLLYVGFTVRIQAVPLAPKLGRLLLRRAA
jgi:DNA-binding XRE family transcriptional regulator